MTRHTDDVRQFRVRAAHEDAHHGRVITEHSFEAAAVAYVEHMPFAANAERQIGIIVHDVQSGHEHRFRIDLGGGEPVASA